MATTAPTPPSTDASSNASPSPRVDSAVSSTHRNVAQLFIKARQKKLGPKITRTARSKFGFPPFVAVDESMDVDASASIAATAIVAAKAAPLLLF